MCKLNAQDRATLEKAKAQAAELVEALTKLGSAKNGLLGSAKNGLLGLEGLDLQQQAISIEKRLGAIQSVTE
ncbi:hypothetical protein ACEP6V_17745 [Pseudomonas aeruginosa]|jgi:hypothetical protein|uniref:Uncharacterized protein n=3 Tax=Pseudomonas TaxID=286 RepID=A0ABD7JX11_PSEAI|nr:MULTISPECIES: hypothetical protein [Pseudomonas]MDU7557807.1 hypothetical protein [Pseudomonas sp.]AVK09476.1 hypothetical protein CSB93_6778 [Pseudomonas paraeruginosa]AWE95524.1 hypothetical protein CSC28_6659 [Pseudomonas paraeruginosa]EKW7191520.1 hypothetical protein [Pseudomonas aeruginosa]ELM3797501.1 hypothetical protein [Pseudomonas aeruginosa]